MTIVSLAVNIVMPKNGKAIPIADYEGIGF
jgi:hypothetical protein